MGNQLFLLFNHTFTEDQERDARDSLGVREINAIPDDLRKLWGQIPPDLEFLHEYLEPFRVWLAELSGNGDYVLIQGDFGATFLMVRFCMEKGLVPIYSTTRREADEERRPDGSVKLIQHFHHQIFRRYGV